MTEPVSRRLLAGAVHLEGFAPGGATLLADHQPVMNAMAELIPGLSYLFPYGRVWIIGHGDPDSDAQAHAWLGLRRAETVRDALRGVKVRTNMVLRAAVAPDAYPKGRPRPEPGQARRVDVLFEAVPDMSVGGEGQHPKVDPNQKVGQAVRHPAVLHPLPKQDVDRVLSGLHPPRTTESTPLTQNRESTVAHFLHQLRIPDAIPIPLPHFMDGWPVVGSLVRNQPRTVQLPLGRLLTRVSQPGAGVAADQAIKVAMDEAQLNVSYQDAVKQLVRHLREASDPRVKPTSELPVTAARSGR